MKPFRFLTTFTSDQRKGIVALFLMIVVFQAAYFILSSYDFSEKEVQSQEEKEWLALQPEIDALKVKAGAKKDTIYPFNPNYISDYKGYALGMTVAEIDRLQSFRKTGKFINSAEDFRKVTKVSDSLLAKLSPYFKFPDWVNKSNKEDTKPVSSYKTYTDKTEFRKEEKKVAAIDINAALEEDLVKVNGIGPYFAKKILRRRAEFGAFASMEQMDDFTDMTPAAISELKKAFFIGPNPGLERLNINTASLQQLSRFPYFNKSVAKAIITQRSMKGKIANVDELSKINGFPVDKIKVIALYLEF